jgi:hypothetical protein
MARATKTKRKRNPHMDNSIAVAEGFHGRGIKGFIDVIEEERYEGTGAKLADLVELVCTDDGGKSGYPIRFTKDRPILASNSNNQLSIIGGDQSLNLSNFEWIEEEERDKQWLVFGEVYSIAYATDKHHLEGSSGKYEEYEHNFGEEGGKLPMLAYDALNEKLYLLGGSYKITDLGIRD